MFRFFILAAVLSLTACGGSSSVNFSPVNSSSTGYAKAGDTIASASAGTRFSTRAPMIFASANSANGSIVNELKTVSSSITMTSDPNVVTLSIAGRIYTLTYDAAESEFSVVDGTGATINAVSAEVIWQREYSLLAILHEEIATLFSSDNTSGLLVAGYSTDPAAVEKRIDAAFYNGIVGLILNGNDIDNSFAAAGPMSLGVNFAQNSVDASLALDVTDLSEIPVGRLIGDGSDAKLIGNRFRGNIEFSSTVPGLTVDHAQIDGSFFGPDAEEVGGSIAGTARANSTDIQLQGAFLAER